MQLRHITVLIQLAEILHYLNQIHYYANHNIMLRKENFNFSYYLMPSSFYQESLEESVWPLRVRWQVLLASNIRIYKYGVNIFNNLTEGTKHFRGVLQPLAHIQVQT